jgi:hypothetical protein
VIERTVVTMSRRERWQALRLGPNAKKELHSVAYQEDRE